MMCAARGFCVSSGDELGDIYIVLSGVCVAAMREALGTSGPTLIAAVLC